MPKTIEAARMNGRPLGIGQLGGYQTPTAETAVLQAEAARAQQAARSYAVTATQEAGALARQASALAAFYVGAHRRALAELSR